MLLLFKRMFAYITSFIDAHQSAIENHGQISAISSALISFIAIQIELVDGIEESIKITEIFKSLGAAGSIYSLLLFAIWWLNKKYSLSEKKRDKDLERFLEIQNKYQEEKRNQLENIRDLNKEIKELRNDINNLKK